MDVICRRVGVKERPEKVDPNQARLTVGGDRLKYPGNCGTPTVNLITVKLFLNSINLTLGEKFATINIKDFYLNTPMKHFEYMGLKLSDLSDNAIKHYNLLEKVTKNNYVYIEVRKGMYGLPPGEILAKEL